jgi:hypothetical protein
MSIEAALFGVLGRDAESKVSKSRPAAGCSAMFSAEVS